MGAQVRNYGCATYQNEEDADIRKGPWTVEEDAILAEYVAIHGEGRWNAAARCAGDHLSPFCLFLHTLYIHE